MRLTLEQMDPFPIGDGPMEKFSHHFEEKQRVRVKETGHTGVLEAINAHNGHMVRLDSGHLLECHKDEIEPEDFPHPEQASAKISHALKTHNPFPVDDYEYEQEPTASRDAGLRSALESGNVSIHDQILIKTATENIANHRTVVGAFPLDDFEEENAKILRIMSGKYAGSSRNTDALHKGAGGNPVDELIKAAVDGLRSGKNIVLPRKCRLPFSRIPILAAAVHTGRISFDWA